MNKLGALAAILIMAGPLSALAQSHSSDDEAACTPDVFKLCSEFIPNEKNIVACLTKKKRELSPLCKKVFARAPSRQTTDIRRPPREHRPR